MNISCYLKVIGFSLCLSLSACSDTATSDNSQKVSYDNENIEKLAKSVTSEQIILYTTPDCTYCNQTKGWLTQNQFAFTDCDMSTSSSCEQQFQAYHGDGTPLIVLKRAGKEHLMREGFDSDEFLQFLQDTM